MGIPVTYLRSSGFGSHDMCEMKYFIEYILGISGPSNMAADKGTIVHKVLEVFAKWKKMTQNGGEAYHDTELNITVDKNTTPDKLTERSFDYYSQAFTHHNWCKKDYDFCIKSVMKVLDSHLDPRKLTIVDAEPFFYVPFNEPWAKFSYEVDGQKLEGQFSIKGTIDLIIQVTKDTYEIVDWKTGLNKNWATGEDYTFEKLFSNPQLRIYHYAAHKLYPDIDNIFVTINYINYGGPITIPFTRSDIVDTIDMLRNKFEKIKRTEIPRVNKTWKCTRFCHYGKSTFEDCPYIVPLVETREGQICPIGTKMTKCEQLRYCFKYRSMPTIIANMKKPGYKLGDYQAPGDTDR